MFFSTELLSKRDGGFGLLWLAATLGPKSSFSKLPKRSVLSADITGLCDLIAQPKEPLSLRLSSNLMVGAARVFRVKHDIFAADVNSCFASLKKAVQDMRATASIASLEMNNPVARPEVLNVSDEPGMARAGLEIDLLVQTWDEFITRELNELTAEDLDEYDPTLRNSKSTAQNRGKRSRPGVEASPHTLDEPQLHLLGNASIDMLESSSQQHASFDLAFDNSRDDEALFNFGGEDGIGLGNLDVDLGLDLGEGWEYPTQATIAEDSFPQLEDSTNHMNLDFGVINGQMDDLPMQMDADFPLVHDSALPRSAITKTGDGGQGRKRVHDDDGDKENGLSPLNLSPKAPRSILVTPSRNDVQGDNDEAVVPKRLAKRVRLLLDADIELTDAEMKRAREKYAEEQNKLRQIELAKKNEKEMMNRIESMMCAPPDTFRAPELLEFWQRTFQVQFETRSGAMYIHYQDDGNKSQKRKRAGDRSAPEIDDFMNVDDYGHGFVHEEGVFGLRASATPEVARRGSKPPSLTGSGLGLDVELPRRRNSPPAHGDQDFESLFPWDNPIGFASSSVRGGEIGSAGPRTPSIHGAEVTRLSGSRSRSRSLANGSPAMRASLREVHGGSEDGGAFGAGDVFDDFQFNLNGDEGLAQSQSQSQTQNMTGSQALAALEKNSFNFLEYAKVQFNARDPGTKSIKFEDIVLSGSSTPHVAAAAFYHCLLLATKNLITVSQPEPFGSIDIGIL